MGVAAADLKITDLQCDGTRSGSTVTVTTTIKIHNHHDDDARHIQVVVVLPPTSHVLSSAPGAVVGPSYPPEDQSWTTNGYVTFVHPSTMGVNATFEMTLVTKMLDAYAGCPIAAFVFGSLPDPNAGNNYCSTSIAIAANVESAAAAMVE